MSECVGLAQAFFMAWNQPSLGESPAATGGDQPISIVDTADVERRSLLTWNVDRCFCQKNTAFDKLGKGEVKKGAL